MPQVRVREVDDTGLALLTTTDRPVDVCFDGRRVWTFWTRRDTEAPTAPATALAGRWPARRAAWPAPLVRHLDGRSRVSVRDSATGEVLFDAELSLGQGAGRIAVQNDAGVDLGFDKSGKLVPTFAGRSEAEIGALLDAVDAVLGALRSAGLDPFLAYGTLLGAVREGAVLGHDSDADLGYVSRHRAPVDVVRESFAVQRRLAREGWRIERYSGAAFKILVTEGDVTRGLDVFGGFLDAGRLYLMGEVGTPFEEGWLHPLGTATLEGRPMPVPARPEKLLEAMYGPGWSVPDPAFRFETPARTTRALDAWFRGTQPGVRHWERHAAIVDGRGPRRARPSGSAQVAHSVAVAAGAAVLDVGAGRGADALWLARQGLEVTAYDVVPRALEGALEVAAAEDLRLTPRRLNLTEWRSVLAEGAALAHDPRPRVVLARHLLDATSEVGRAAFARLCSMALRGGGTLVAEMFVPDGPLVEGAEETRTPGGGRGPVAELPEWVVGRPTAAGVTTLLRDAGAIDVQVSDLRDRGRPAVRLTGVW